MVSFLFNAHSLCPGAFPSQWGWTSVIAAAPGLVGRLWGRLLPPRTFTLPLNCSFPRALSMIGLVLIAFGTGGIKPCVSAFGGDQFEEGQVRTWTPGAPFMTDTVPSDHRAATGPISVPLFSGILESKMLTKLSQRWAQLPAPSSPMIPNKCHNLTLFYDRKNRETDSFPSFIWPSMLEACSPRLSLPYLGVRTI